MPFIEYDISKKNTKAISYEQMEDAAEKCGNDRIALAKELNVTKTTVNAYLRKPSFHAAFTRGLQKPKLRRLINFPQ